MTPEETIKSYYRCWVTNDRSGARALLADKLTFRSPQDNFDNADDFIETCWRYAEQFNSFDIQHAVYDTKAAYIVYGSETFCCGELIKLQDDKISAIYVTFNPTR